MPAALVAPFLQTTCTKVQHGLSSPGLHARDLASCSEVSEGFRGVKRLPGHGSRMP